MELPILADPQTLDLSAFVNWKSRWKDYLRLNRIETELTDAPLQQAFLRTALDPAWVSVWDAGLLGIQHGHLFPDTVQRLGDYIRKSTILSCPEKSFMHGLNRSVKQRTNSFLCSHAWRTLARFEDDHICTRCNRQCSYRSQFRDIQLRERLTCGLRDSHLVRRILEQHYDNNLSLEQVLQMCVAHESAANTQSDLHRSPAMAMAVKSCYRKAQTGHPTPRTTPAEKRSSRLCPFCGEDFHTRDQCPASRKRCLKCGKIGHFRSVCKRQLEPKTSAELDSVLAEPVEEPDSVGTSPSGAVGHLYVHRLSTKDRMVDVAVTLEGSVPALIKWQPDTGADVDAIPLACF